jgi:hypothetical protein
MRRDLIHIFDNSACLSRRQLAAYVTGSMTREECHAVELHVSDCLFCSEAVAGAAQTPEEAAAELAGLDAGFLTEHFASQQPQVHLNAFQLPMAGSAAGPGQARRAAHPYRSVPLAVVMLLVLLFLFREWRSQQNDRLPSPARSHVAAAGARIDNSAADPFRAAVLETVASYIQGTQ